MRFVHLFNFTLIFQEFQYFHYIISCHVESDVHRRLQKVGKVGIQNKDFFKAPQTSNTPRNTLNHQPSKCKSFICFQNEKEPFTQHVSPIPSVVDLNQHEILKYHETFPWRLFSSKLIFSNLCSQSLGVSQTWPNSISWGLCWAM